MKVVINSCFGGFSLSPQAELWLFEKGYDGEDFKRAVKDYWKNLEDNESLLGYKHAIKSWREFLKNSNPKERASLFVTTFTPDEKFVLNAREIPRNHPLLVECVETLKEKSYGACAKLKIVDIPDNIEWQIEEYDGQEHIAQVHETWS